MSSPFSRSRRVIESDRFLNWPALVIAIGLFAAWASWFLLARVPLYESSATARIEATATTHRVDARLSGRVVRVNLQ
jgi:multidrug resistance efflux pump